MRMILAAALAAPVLVGPVLFGPVVAGAAAPGSAGQKRDTVPVATPDGKAVSCLRLNQVRESIVRDGKTIDFVMAGGKVYRNVLDGGDCPGLGFQRRFSHQTSTNDICSTDIITVLEDPGLRQGASCGLGTFQPVTLAKR